MSRLLAAAGLVFSLALAPAGLAEDGKAKPASVKIAKDEKVCRYKFPDGEKRTWTCKKAEPCCAWDLIKYVKCGSTITGCL